MGRLAILFHAMPQERDRFHRHAFSAIPSEACLWIAIGHFYGKKWGCGSDSPAIPQKTQCDRGIATLVLRSRGPATSALGPFGPECPRSVPESAPKNGGVRRRSIPRGVPGPSGVSKKFPERVPEVSGTPFWHSGGTLGTLKFGHSGAHGTLRRTPPFSGTFSGTLPGRARGTPVTGPRDRNTCLAIGGISVGSLRFKRQKDRCCQGVATVGIARSGQTGRQTFQDDGRVCGPCALCTGYNSSELPVLCFRSAIIDVPPQLLCLSIDVSQKTFQRRKHA